MDYERRLVLRESTLCFHGEGDASFSPHFLAEDAEVDLTAGGGWDAAWSSSSDTRIVVACLPHSLVPSARRALLALGRAVTFEEPCGTYDLPTSTWTSWVGEHPEWVTAPVLDAASVGAAFGVPAGYRLGELREADAAHVDAAWKYRTAKSVEMVKISIATRPSAGLWDDATGALVSFCITRNDGSLGLLGTLPTVRGRGFAKYVVKFIALQLLRWQHALRLRAEAAPQDAQAAAMALLAHLCVPYCHIKLGNIPSEALFRSLGFVDAQRPVTWVISSKLAPRFRLRPIDTGSDAEVGELLAMIRDSYKKDDAFFVDQWRMDEQGLREVLASPTGRFFVGYRMDAAAAAAAGVGLDAGSAALDSCAPHDAEVCVGDARELLAAVFIDVLEGGGAEPGKRERVAHLSLLTITPALKRIGMGQRVLTATLATARTMGATHAEAFVVSVKPWLLRFYVEGNGWREVGTAPWPPEMDYQLILPVHFRVIRKSLDASG
jgi:GNAT superfamily N-acetyltransferase